MQTQNVVIHGDTATVNVWRNANHRDQTPIHFAHGNGFNAGTYRAFVEQLATERDLFALNHRATWTVSRDQKPPAGFSWQAAADDMIAGIEQFAPDGVIGVGHSLGGVMTLFAAAKRPDLFKQIILIEPVVFPTRMFLAVGWMPVKWRLKFAKIAQSTLRRRDVWASVDEFVDFHIAKPAFHGISREVMTDYAVHGLRPTLGGDRLELVYPKVWEAHIFLTPAYVWRALATLKVPCVCFRAERSQWIPNASWQKWQKIRPDIPLHVLPKLDHMAPLQDPIGVAQKVLSQLHSSRV